MVKKSDEKNGLQTESYGAIGAALRALEVKGVTAEHLALLRSNRDYAERVAKFMIEDMQKELNHEYDIVPCSGCSDVKCKHVGFWKPDVCRKGCGLPAFDPDKIGYF